MIFSLQSQMTHKIMQQNREKLKGTKAPYLLSFLNAKNSYVCYKLGSCDLNRTTMLTVLAFSNALHIL